MLGVQRGQSKLIVKGKMKAYKSWHPLQHLCAMGQSLKGSCLWIIHHSVQNNEHKGI